MALMPSSPMSGGEFLPPLGGGGVGIGPSPLGQVPPQMDIMDMLSQMQEGGGPQRMPYNFLSEEEAIYYPNLLPRDTSFMQEMQDRMFSPTLGQSWAPQIGVSAGFGALVGLGAGGPVGAALGAGIGAVADILGTAGEVGVRRAMDGEDIETPLGSISPEMAGMLTNLAIQLPATGGLTRAAIRGAKGLGWIAKAKDIEEQVGLPLRGLLPPHTKLYDTLATMPTGKAFYEVDPRYKAIFRAAERLGRPPDWDSLFMNWKKFSPEVREWMDKNMLSPTEDIFKAPELEGVLKQLFPVQAATKGAAAFSDFVWQRLFHFAARPERVLYGDEFAMRGLQTMQSSELWNRSLAGGAADVFKKIFDGVPTEDQNLLSRIWLHAQGHSTAQLRKAGKKPTALDVDDIFPKAVGDEKRLLEEMQKGRTKVGKKQLSMFDSDPRITPEVSFAQEREKVMNLLTRQGRPDLIPKYEALQSELQFMGQTLVDLGLLKPDKLIPNYLSFVRQTYEAQGQKLVELPNGYFPVSIKKIIPNKGQAYFLRNRRLTDPPTDLGLKEIWDTYANAYSHLLVNHAMFPRMQTIMENVQDTNKANYLGSMFNYFVGNKGGPGASLEIGRDMSNIMKTAQFWRVIGGSFLTPIVNLSQRVNILGHASYGNWMRGFLPNAHLDKRSREMGLIDELTGMLGHAGDVDEVWYNAIMGGKLKKFGDIIAWPFVRSEMSNRRHAFRSAFYEAMGKPGMTTEAAEEYAKYVVENTQFITKIARTPAIMRSELGSVVGQFKMYMVNQLGFMETLMRKNPKGAARLMSGAVTLFGPDILFPGMDVMLSRHFLGSPEKSPFKGVIGHLGASMVDRASIFGVGKDDLTSLGQFLPGPAYDHARSVMEATLGIDLNFIDQSKFGMPLTPDQRASKALRSIPFAGAQLNRIRGAAKLMTSEQEDRGALDFMQAMGMETATGPLHDRVTGGEAALRMFGLYSPRVQERQEMMTMVRGVQDEYREIMGRVNEALAAGRSDLADEMLQRFRRKYPEIAYFFPTYAGTKKGQERLLMPDAWRLLQGLPKELQHSYYQQIIRREGI